MGLYCSYCERHIQTGLAVEHIQPKGLKLPDGSEPYRHLEGCWTNFLIACINCNSTKLDKDVDLTTILLPDRDNTLMAFVYSADGKIAPVLGAPASATALIHLVGLSKDVRQTYDHNGELIALDRASQRMETWDLALRNRARWQRRPTTELKESIVELAGKSGFFSIWMTVFSAESELRREFIRAFKAAPDCFDPTTTAPVSPRPANGLAHGGKI